MRNSGVSVVAIVVVLLVVVVVCLLLPVDVDAAVEKGENRRRMPVLRRCEREREGGVVVIGRGVRGCVHRGLRRFCLSKGVPEDACIVSPACIAMAPLPGSELMGGPEA